MAITAAATCANSIAAMSRETRPEAALRAWAIDATANAQLAAREQILAGGKGDHAMLRALAERSLARSPTNGVAARVLGFVAAQEGDLPAAFGAMRFAHALTRRDLATELWLIEYHVQRDDVPRVLKHFDAAASTSQQAMGTLFPILITAVEDDRLVMPIADTLKRDPWWSQSLLRGMADQSTAPDNVWRLFAELSRSGIAIQGETLGVLRRRYPKVKSPSGLKVVAPSALP
ncbi:MAG: hypothetical protein ACKVOP_04350 [Sphingomonadaceae bacterium]